MNQISTTILALMLQYCTGSVLVLVVLLVLVALYWSCTNSILNHQCWTGLGYEQLKTIGQILVCGLLSENIAPCIYQLKVKHKLFQHSKFVS